jgi:hypothetical protein
VVDDLRVDARNAAQGRKGLAGISILLVCLGGRIVGVFQIKAGYDEQERSAATAQG